MIKRSQVLEELTSRIVQIVQPHPLRVAIDGPDAAGKTTLANELAPLVRARGRPVIRASVDGFHNPVAIRYRRGRASPEGYYRDSFNYHALAQSLLVPLGPGGSRQYRSAVFDYRTDSEVPTAIQVAETNAVLLFDGVFLLRPDLMPYWDYTVFVEAAFGTILARAERRDAAWLGGVEEVRRRYGQRYIPGQKLYFDECHPKGRAKVIVDNNDPENAVML